MRPDKRPILAKGSRQGGGLLLCVDSDEVTHTAFPFFKFAPVPP